MISSVWLMSVLFVHVFGEAQVFGLGSGGSGVEAMKDPKGALDERWNLSCQGGIWSAWSEEPGRALTSRGAGQSSSKPGAGQSSNKPGARQSSSKPGARQSSSKPGAREARVFFCSGGSDVETGGIPRGPWVRMGSLMPGGDLVHLAHAMATRELRRGGGSRRKARGKAAAAGGEAEETRRRREEGGGSRRRG